MPLASDWGNALTELLPFVLLIGFWLFLRERIRKDSTPQQTLEKLGQIHEELIRLRKSIENRP